MLAELAVFAGQILFLRCFFDSAQELRLFHRLRNEVVGPLFDRLDGDLDRAVAGDHDDFNVLLDGLRALEKFHPVHYRQAQIGDQNIDVLFVQDIERLLPVIGLEHLIFGGPKNFHHRCAVFNVVFDDEDCGSFSYSHNGNKIENVDPLPAWLSTTRCPLCSKIICCEVASPRPVPCAFVVKKGSNSLE